MLKPVSRLRGACLAAFGLLACALVAAPAPNGRLWRDGDRVVFFGDSITHGGAYPEYLALYYATRFPTRRIWFSNSGWAGAAVPQGIASIDEDVAEKKPTVVTVMFGMNDVNRGAWPRGAAQPGAPLTAPQQRAVEAFAANMTNLVRLVREKAGDPEIVYVTPSPYDQTCVDGERLSDTVCNDGLELLAEKVRRWARRDGAMCVDLQENLRQLNARFQKKDPSFSILRKEGGGLDRVHPGALGHMAFAYYWLKAQGAPARVAHLDVNAATGNTALSDGATLSDVKADRRNVSFTALEQALPFPYTPAMAEIDRYLPFTDDLNQEVLTVRYLKAGEYDVLIDGETVGTWANTMLAQGVNLAICPTAPQVVQAQKARALNARIWELERTLRLFATRRRWARMHYRLDPDDLEAVAALRRGMEETGKAKGNYDYHTYGEYLQRWPERAKVYDELVQLRRELLVAVKPVPHVFEIRRK